MATSSILSQNSKYSHYHAVTHVVFDLDGTLVDTEDEQFELFTRLLARRNKALPHDFNSRLRGLTTDLTIKCLREEFNIEESYEELVNEMKSLEEGIYKSQPVRLKKGAEKLIKHFFDHNIPIAIATNSTRRQVDLKFQHHAEFFKMINHVVTCDDVFVGKPDPSIYIQAAKLFPKMISPSACLAFEDSKNGLLAAVRAGMQCIFIPEVDMNDDMEIAKNATMTLKSLENFKPELFGLPAIK